MRIAVVGSRIGWIAIALAMLAGLVVGISLRGSSAIVTPELPPWFGDANRPATLIAGKVIGAPNAMTVHLLLDVPDPKLWTYRAVRTSRSGEFDFGPVRAGRYRLFADGNGSLSRVVSIDTMRGAGDRIELVAHAWRTIAAHLDRNYDWQQAHRLSTERARPWFWPGLLTIGAVLRADGTPAASVGVQPIACGYDSHSLPEGMSVVATTNIGGGFAFVPRDFVCGLRIHMGPAIHEIVIPRDQVPPLIQLPPPGREQQGIFDSHRHAFGDRRGAWLRGRVVRAGVGVGDVDIGALVLPPNYCMDVVDETRTRSDGSFQLFISSKKLDKHPHVALSAGKTLTELSGLQVVRVRPGETLDDVTIEIGEGMRVSGTVVDENGYPMIGVPVAVDPYNRSSWSTTGIDGRFQLTVGPQGRYRLHALTTDRIEHAPVHGVLPKVDVVNVDGEQTGVKVVVRRNERREIREHTERGCVNLGLRKSYRTVLAVGDELEAAGLRPGDEIMSTELPGIELEQWELQPSCVPWGQAVVLTVKRGDETIVVRATAPHFGSSLSK